MQLDFTNLFHSSDEVIEIDTVIDLSDLEYSTYKPLKNGVKVQGKAFCKADVAYLQLDVSFDFFGVCDRCAQDIHKQYAFDVDKIVVAKLENEQDNDEYIVLENAVLDLNGFIAEEIQLFLPYKMLCSEDCKGICSKCGKNLNSGKCDCEKETDPRWDALSQLLDIEEE